MGARRFSPTQGRFLQRDHYHGAVANLGLSLDPLTGNRYGFAWANPISYVETDGHAPVWIDVWGGDMNYWKAQYEKEMAEPGPAPSPGLQPAPSPPTATPHPSPVAPDAGEAGDTVDASEPALALHSTGSRSLASATRERYGNGCGPGGLWGIAAKAVPDHIPHVFDFSDACERHDRGFGTWGTWRFQLDERFRDDTRASCAEVRGGSGALIPRIPALGDYNTNDMPYTGEELRQLCNITAHFYYNALKDHGFDAFFKAQTQKGVISNCEHSRRKCLRRARYRGLYPDDPRRESVGYP